MHTPSEKGPIRLDNRARVRSQEIPDLGHGAEYRELRNGMTIIGFTDQTQFPLTSVSCTVPRGSVLDPNNMQGITHLGEHMLPYPFEDAAGKHLLQFNAYTSATEVSEYIEGTTSLARPDFGIIPVLERFARTIENPLQFYDEAGNLDEQFAQTALAAQKERVMDEIDITTHDHNRMIFRLAIPHIFDSKNPIVGVARILGTKESVAGISLDDLRTHIKRLFAPQDMVVSVSSRGSAEELKAVVDKLEVLLDKVNSAEEVVNINNEHVNDLHPDFRTSSGPGD